MGSTAKKDRRSGEYLDGKTSPPLSVRSVCFVIYAEMKDLFGLPVRRDIERFVLYPRLDYSLIVSVLDLASFCDI